MTTLIYVLAIIFGALLFLGFCWLLVKLQISNCKTCPFQKECDSHQGEEDFVPKCFDTRMKDLANFNKYADQ